MPLLSTHLWPGFEIQQLDILSVQTVQLLSDAHYQIIQTANFSRRLGTWFCNNQIHIGTFEWDIVSNNHSSLASTSLNALG